MYLEEKLDVVNAIIGEVSHMDRISDFAAPETSPYGLRLELSRKVNVPRSGNFSGVTRRR